ncbi:MAG: tyrosine-type recombinase/integrase [Flavobacteriaceae bacterium]|nr:tyrosine-type recombinase/integrase [Flavobacteriaceae bacterium]
MNLSEFLDYLSLERGYSGHTVLAYQRDILSFWNFVQDTEGVNALADLHYVQIRCWIVHLVEQGRTNRTINRKIASLKAYYTFLVRTRQIEQNPLAGHKRLKEDKNLVVPFSEGEVLEVLYTDHYTDDFIGARNRFMVELFYATGMRRAELVALRLGAIDENKKTVKVLGKRNKERIIPLLDSCLLAYRNYLKSRNTLPDIVDAEHLFLRESGNKIYPMLVYRVINSYFSKASSKLKTSPHVLRHTFATHLLNHGADLNSVKELLGHASLAATQVYVHNSIGKIKNTYANSHPRSKK